MSKLRVPAGLYFQSRFFAATAKLWQHLASLESTIVREETETLEVDRPVYIASLPRSGTSIVTEMLANHPALACHRYSDFPNVWTPYWRNYLLQKTQGQMPELQERAHRDRIEVNNGSPEAVEEVLWMHFFPDLHDASVSNVLTGELQNEQFNKFYRQHILKLLAVRKARRYLAKGNYNISRLRYILALNPDAKFLIPVRDPVNQVASLAKQHALFTQVSQEDPRIPLQMAMSGHFEFGPQRTPVNFGNTQTTDTIIDCWQQGHEVEGWARYWADSYQHIYQQLNQFPEVRKACLVFRYEDLCTEPKRVINAILEHCELPENDFNTTREEYINRLSLPDYYRVDFSPDELLQIGHHCDPVNEKLSKL